MASRSIELEPARPMMERVNRASGDSSRAAAYRDEEAEPYRDEVPKASWSDPFHGDRRKPVPLWRSPMVTRSLYIGLLLLCSLVAFRLGHDGDHSTGNGVVPDFLRSDLLSNYRGDHKDLDSKVATLKTRPGNTHIVGLVFFGRPIFVNILDCYLQKNLRVNGGALDEVRFILHTTSQGDIKWLENLVEEGGLKDHYKLLYEEEKLEQELWDNGGAFSYLWGKYATDDDTIYVKIDDDLVFIEDSTIPRMINSLLAHPEAYSIQANIINSRFTHWFHHTTGAILPFLPDPADPSDSDPPIKDWRTSTLPRYPIHQLPPGDEPVLPHYVDARTKNPTWLPLPVTTKNLLRTPFGDGYDLPDPKTGVKDPAPRWPLAAQEHLSLLHNLEHGTLHSYWFGRAGDGIWNTWFQHYNVNFMAFWGKSIALRPFWNASDPDTFLPNDEYALTIDVPRELGMPVLVDTRALVSHFAFHGSHQRDGLMKTDLLDRYRLLANDRACKPDNQKSALTGSETDDYEESQGDGTEGEPAPPGENEEDPANNSANFQEGG